MKIKIDNLEFEFLPEDLRHFKVNTAQQLHNFIDEVRALEKNPIGFKKEK
jgi:hypothetical protein